MRKNLILSILTGLLFAFSFPPFKTGFIAYFAFIPFYLLLENKSYKETIRWGYVCGFFIDVFTLFWLGWVTVLGLIASLLALPLLFTLYGVLHKFLLDRLKIWGLLALPFLWTSYEYVISMSEMGFPWQYIGYSQSYYLPFIQLAEFGSVYIISFWVILLNVIVYQAYKTHLYKQHVILFILVFLIPLPFGMKRLGEKQAQPHITVAAIQGNIDPFEKWDPDLDEEHFAVYIDNSKKMLKHDPQLILWPETASPFYLKYEHKYRNIVHGLADSANVSFIAGSVDYQYNKDGYYEYYNAALFFTPGNTNVDNYVKTKLVPFSERVPYKNAFPFKQIRELLADLKYNGLGNYSKGNKTNVFTMRNMLEFPDNSIKVGTAICYDSIFPELLRGFVKNGANMFAIITNDAWFGPTSAPFHHSQIAVFRAIENRRSIARCANTGISCFIDPYGRVTENTPLYKLAAISESLPIRQDVTFFTKYGNIIATIFSYASLTFLLIGVLIGFFRKDR